MCTKKRKLGFLISMVVRLADSRQPGPDLSSTMVSLARESCGKNPGGPEGK